MILAHRPVARWRQRHELAVYQAAVDVDGQKDAIGKIQRLLHEDAPACYHTFFNYLAGHSNEVQGLQTTSLGHLLFQNATKG